MESMDFSLYLLFSTALLSIILAFKFILTKSTSNQQLPPGPWKLPIINGSLHHLASRSLPHRLLRDLSNKYGKIMHLQLGEISTVVISSPRLAKEIMKTHDHVFAYRPSIAASEIMFYNKTDITFAPYGDYWREMRKICVQELLHPKNVKSFHHIREQVVLCMIDMIRPSLGLPINLSERLFSLANSILCQTAFGTRSQKDLAALITQSLFLFGGFNIVDLFPSLGVLHGFSSIVRKLNFMHQKIDKAFDVIIAERRENSMHPSANKGNKGQDLLDALLALQQSGSLDFPFTETNIKAIMTQMFVAGTDTSAATIEWAMAEMLRNPEIMAKAQAEIRQEIEGNKTTKTNESDAKPLGYLKLIIKETLRLHPPAPLLVPRQSLEACEIDVYNIPEKTKFFINAWAIGRDPDVWEDAETFLPERFAKSSIDFMGNDFEFIPFGAGRRMCPGISFGTAVVEHALVQLLYHFNWRLQDGIKPEDLDMTETSGISAIRQNKL